MPEIVIDMDMAGPATLIADAFDLLFSARSRVVEIRGSSPNDRMINVRMVIDETMLRDEMRDFAWRIFVLSIVISLITAGLVFLSLHGLMVRPVRRMVDAIMAFRRDPENPAAIVPPTTRGDELGEAQRELAEMQIVLRSALRQQQRLATLGTAVAKIHHDLGGILSTAALVSERIADSDLGQRVQRGWQVVAEYFANEWPGDFQRGVALVSGYLEPLAQSTNQTATIMQGNFQIVANYILDEWPSDFQRGVDMVSSYLSELPAKAQTAFDNFRTALTNLPGQLMAEAQNVGKAIVDGIANGIRSGAGAIAQAARDAATAALNAANPLLPVSPSIIPCSSSSRGTPRK
jgi:hypothetical protein